MSHPTEQELVLYLLGDAGEDASQALEHHLQGCAACAEQVDEIRRLLRAAEGLAVPEPDAGFEARIWARQQAALRDRAAAGAGSATAPASVPHPRFWSARRLVLAGAVAASLVVAFLAGLYTPPPGTVAVDPDEQVRERVLLVAVGDHLQRARMVLVELTNADPNGPVDMRTQQAAARTLLGNNRLYRQTASLTGQTAVADLLEELERVLLEVARSPEDMPAEEIDWLRERIQSRDLLFKVSVIEGTARKSVERPRKSAGRL